MIISTTDAIEGRTITKVLGVVNGSTVRARHIGKDILAGIKNLVGGEISQYTKLLAEAREHSTQRMIERAEELGGNAIVGMRFGTSMVAQGSAEILAYGTAVVLGDSN